MKPVMASSDSELLLPEGNRRPVRHRTFTERGLLYQESRARRKQSGIRTRSKSTETRDRAAVPPQFSQPQESESTPPQPNGAGTQEQHFSPPQFSQPQKSESTPPQPNAAGAQKQRFSPHQSSQPQGSESTPPQPNGAGAPKQHFSPPQSRGHQESPHMPLQSSGQQEAALSHTSELRERLTAPVLPSGPPHVQQTAPPDSSMNTVTSSQAGEAQLQKHPPASPMQYGAGSSDYTSGPPQFAKAQEHPLALPQSSRAQFHGPQQDLGHAAPPTWDYTTPPHGIKHFRHFPGDDITPEDSVSQASSDRKSSRYYKSSKTGWSSRTSKSSRSSSSSLRLHESWRKLHWKPKRQPSEGSMSFLWKRQS